jgi:hypothetical protein
MMSGFRFVRDGQAGRTERGHASASGPRFLATSQFVERHTHGNHRIEIHFRAGQGAVGRDQFGARIFASHGELIDSLSGFASKEQALMQARRRIELLTASAYRTIAGR